MSLSSTLRDAIAPGGPTLTGQVVDTAATLITVDLTFAAGSTNVAAALAFVRSTTQQFYFLTDQPLTMKTNSSGSPADTFNLVAGAPFRWSRSEGYFAMPFSADVTSIFVTCAQTTRLRVYVLTN